MTTQQKPQQKVQATAQKNVQKPKGVFDVNKKAKSMTVMYFFGLILFIVLTFDGFLLLQGTFKSSQFSLNRIDVVIDQLRLLERSVILVREIVETPSLEKCKKLKEELMTNLGSLEYRHNALITGDSKLHLTANKSQKIKDVYYEKPFYLDKGVSHYIKEVKILDTIPDAVISTEHEDVQLILNSKKPKKLAQDFNELLNVSIAEHSEDLKHMQSLENIIFVLTMFLILIASFVIFRPIVKDFQASFTALETTNVDLEKKVEERTITISKLNKELQDELEELKQTQEVLRKSEEVCRLITDNMDDLVAVVNLDGTRVYNNPAYKKIFGDGGVKSGTDSFSEIHPDDQGKIKNAFEQILMTGLPQRAEYRFLLGDGSVRYIESVGSCIKNENGNPDKVIIVARDITQRKQEEIQEQQEILRQVSLGQQGQAS